MLGPKTNLSIRALTFILTILISILSLTIHHWWAALQAGCASSAVCQTVWYERRLMAWRFSIFVGAFANFGTTLGMFAATKWGRERVPWVAVLVSDALSGLFLVAGAVTLSFMFANGVCDSVGPYAIHCRQVPADTAFMYVAFVLFIASIVTGVLGRARAAAKKEEEEAEKRGVRKSVGIRGPTFV